MKLARLAVVAIAAAVMLSAGMTHAEIIYLDNFDSGSSGDQLLGNAPDVRPGAETWSGTGVFKYDGAGAVYFDHNDARSNHLPLTIEDDLIYTLTARVRNARPDTSSDWIAIGWAENDHYAGFNSSSSSASRGHYWMIWRGSTELRAFVGPATASSADGGSGTNAPGEGDELDLRIVLDQLAATPTAYFQYKNPSESQWTEYASVALNDTLLNNISRVGISASSTLTGVSSFELTAVPEPASWLLLLSALACGLLVRRRR